MSRSKILIGSVPNESRSADCYTLPAKKKSRRFAPGLFFLLHFEFQKPAGMAMFMLYEPARRALV